MRASIYIYCVYIFVLSYVMFVCPEEDADSVENLTINLSSIVSRFSLFCAFIFSYMTRINFYIDPILMWIENVCFPRVLWLWHFLYSVGPHQVSSLHIYTFVVSRAFMAGAASQAGDADTSRAPGLTSDLQGSVNVHRCALLLVPQWQCISYFVFYIVITLFIVLYI